jgi:hypothetical protein
MNKLYRSLTALVFIFAAFTGKIMAQSQPTVNACCLTLNTQTTTTLNFDWVRGNGDYCLVVMRQTSNSLTLPVDGNTYSASTSFGSGSNLGNANYVVYKGTGTSVTVSNLAIGTYYEAMVYEFNSLTFPYSPNYTTSYGYLYMYTLATQPTVQTSGLTASNLTPTSAYMNWTNGNGAYNLLLMRQYYSYTGTPTDGVEYSYSSCFGSGSSVGSSSPYAYDCYDGGSSTAITVSCLQPQTDYSASIYTYNGSSGANNYLTTGNSYEFFTTPCLEPTATSNWLYVTDIKDNAFTINWMKPSGSGTYSLVTVKQGTSNTNTPTDMTAYTANTVFGSGSQVGTGSYVVYNSSGNTVRVTGLTAGTYYTVSVFEFNQYTTFGNYNNTHNYLTSSYTTQITQTNDPEPTTAPSGLTLTPSSTSVTASWTNGNGNKHIATVKPTRISTALAFDGTNDYIATTSASGLQPSGAVTVEAWAYKSDWVNNVGWQTIAGNHEGTGGYQLFSYYGYVYAYCERNGSVGAAYQDVTYLTPGWHHFAFTFDGRYTALYVDGAKKDEVDAGATYPITYQYANTFIIGADAGTSTTPAGNYFNGYLDEVRVWNTARTYSQIRSNMYNSLVGNETGLVAEWSMDDGYSTTGTAKNNSLNYTAYNGTLTNMTTTSASSFTGTSGWILSGSGVNSPIDFSYYGAGTTFMTGTQVGQQYYTVYNSTGNSVTVSGLTPGTYYNFSVYDENSTAWYNYKTDNYLTQDFQTTPGALPTITSFSPINGTLGSTVTITGTNFDGSIPSNNLVYFGTERATVLSATSTSIQVQVPYCTNNVPLSVTVNNLTAYSRIPFIVTSGCSAPINTSSFTNSSMSGGSAREGIVGGDVDNDGKADILYVDGGYPYIYFQKNTSTNGTLSFNSAILYTLTTTPYDLGLGDLDGDYKLDPVVVSNSSNQLTIFRNTSSPSLYNLVNKIDLPTLPSPTHVAIADVDKDGKPDVIVSYSTGSSFSIFRNTSSVGYISFANRIDIGGVNGPFSVQAGDIDGDGKADIVAGNYGSTGLVIFRNTSTVGNISFAAGVAISTVSAVLDVALADLDNDNDPDIVASYSTTSVGVFKNNNTTGNITSGNTPLQTTLTAASTYGSVEVYDLDGDNKNDIVVGYSAAATVSVFEQTGNFVFGTRQDFAGSSSGSFWQAIDDFSYDGKSDILTGTGGPTITTLNNVINALASEPTNQVSSITFSNVTQTSMTVNFNGGSGANRIVVAKAGSAVNALPFDGVGYNPNTAFGLGDDLGGGNYVVYNSNGTSVNVTGLNSYTTYYFAVFDYNGSSCTANYLTSPVVSNNTITLNTPPVITSIADPSPICQSSGQQTVNMTGIGSGAANEVQTLSVTATSNNQTLIPNGNITVNYTSPSTTGSINYTPANGQSGSAIITVTVNDNATNNNITTETFTVVVNPPPTNAVAGPDQYICTSSTTLAANTPAVGTGQWSFIYTSNVGINITNINSPTSTITGFNSGDSVRLRWTITNSPCTNSFNGMSIKRNSCPLDANYSANQTSICGTTANVVYTDASTVQNPNFITAWSWSFPGGTPSSATGPGPHTIFYSSPGQYSSSLQVTDNSATTNLEVKPNYVTITAPPGAAGTISGNLTVCQGQTGATYSVPVIPGATSYTWSVPTGGSIISGQGTTNIVVDFSSSATTGNVTVYGSNSCGNGTTSFQLVTVNPLPANTPTITGSASVCQGQTGVTYSVAAINNATGYSWVVPSGATITSGNNTQSITVSYASNAVSGIVNVFGTNSCGSGSSTNGINVSVNPLPDPAGAITGTSTVCQGDTVVYSITALGNTSGYSWSVPAGASIISGNNTPSITVAYGTSSTSGNVTVYGANACGSGTNATLAITVNPLPGNATGIVGSTTICAGSNSNIYFVSAIPNAVNYSWSLPNGFTITAGNNTNAIQVSLSPTASSGTLSVYGSNACGDGGSSSVNITVSPLPDSAGAIAGAGTVCQGQTSVTYTIPAIANATGYNWSVPLGASIVSGNNTTSITVDYSTSAVSGNITVIGTNTCGNGLSADTFAVTVNPLPGDALPIAGDSSIQICPMQTGVLYTTQLVPNATSYNWTLPAGAAIVGGNGMDSIIVDYSTGAQSGLITVTPTNACGTGATATWAVNVDTIPSLDLCMVTVNGNSSFNHVIWEKPVSALIDSFRIYREIANVYVPIATVPYGAYSDYTDSVYTPIADPNVTNYRYKISALDSCGNESTLSPHHRTIFLQANQGVGNTVNLNWVPYEGDIEDTVYQYYIYRDTVGSGNLDLIDSVTGGNQNYTDNNPSQNVTTLRYVIGTDWNISCNPSFKVIPSTMAAINNSHSNIKNLIFTPNAVINIEAAYGISVYPNPSDGLFTISLKNMGGLACSFTVYDELGRPVMRDKINGSAGNGKVTRTVDMTGVAGGVYSIRFEIGGVQTVKKLVIQK